MGRKSAAQKARARARKLARMSAAPVAAPMIPDWNGSDGGPVRPPPAQLARGAYLLPEGKDKAERPAVNLRPDRIAELMVPPARLDAIQHDAARDWQSLRYEVRAEIGAKGYRSCLDITVAGHDESEGNAALMCHWRMVNRVLGPMRVALLDRVCLEGAKPVNLDAFRAALDAFAIVQGRA